MPKGFEPNGEGSIRLKHLDHRPAVLVLDNDSTIMTGEILDEIAAVVQEETGIDVAAAIKEITDSKMNGDPGAPETFQESLDMRVAILVKAGLNQAMIKKAVGRMEFSPSFIVMLKTMIRLRGTLEGHVFISSGGFAEVITRALEEHFESEIGSKETTNLISQVASNDFSFEGSPEAEYPYVVPDEALVTGVNKETSEMISETAKFDRVQQLIEEGRINMLKYRIIGSGDGSNDVKMVKRSQGLDVAYTGVVARGNTIKKANYVTADNFYELLYLALSPAERHRNDVYYRQKKAPVAEAKAWYAASEKMQKMIS